MISAIISRLTILLFGTLYPAYSSYKAVRTKNVREYVKWMMYWIVFALFTVTETFTDIFLSWFPFYYEFKVIIVLWLLSPATKGSSTLYRKFVHPMLTRREQDIDEYLNQAKERGYTAVLELGSKGVNYATNVIMQTALKTFYKTGGIKFPAIQASTSDHALASNHYRRDVTDAPMPRSRSLEMTPTRLDPYFEGSSEDEDFHLDDIPVIFEEDQVDTGAARARDPPKRKTKNSAMSKKSNKFSIKSRRKIKDDPEVHVDVD